MQEPYQIHTLHGHQITPWLDPLGSLRIRIFREYPYLYDGTLEYERDYLSIYRNAVRSLVVIITDKSGNLVGATTCLPLAEESDEFQQPFISNGLDIFSVMYFGESILLPEWRGRGIGKIFFDRREAYALDLEMETTTFCAVDRPANHPLRPAGYRPLDTFWESRGYASQPGLQATFDWKEIGETVPSPKTLTFWTKSWKS